MFLNIADCLEPESTSTGKLIETLRPATGISSSSLEKGSAQEPETGPGPSSASLKEEEPDYIFNAEDQTHIFRLGGSSRCLAQYKKMGPGAVAEEGPVQLDQDKEQGREKPFQSRNWSELLKWRGSLIFHLKECEEIFQYF